MANEYRSQIRGETLEERFESIVALFGQRNVPLSVDYVGTNLPVAAATTAESPANSNNAPVSEPIDVAVPGSSPELPILSVWACPYPQLAEQDRGICSLEKMLLTDLLGTRVKLTECRLDGGIAAGFKPRRSPIYWKIRS